MGNVPSSEIPDGARPELHRLSKPRVGNPTPTLLSPDPSRPAPGLQELSLPIVSPLRLSPNPTYDPSASALSVNPNPDDSTLETNEDSAQHEPAASSRRNSSAFPSSRVNSFVRTRKGSSSFTDLRANFPLFRRDSLHQKKHANERRTFSFTEHPHTMESFMSEFDHSGSSTVGEVGHADVDVSEINPGFNFNFAGEATPSEENGSEVKGGVPCSGPDMALHTPMRARRRSSQIPGLATRTPAPSTKSTPPKSKADAKAPTTPLASRTSSEEGETYDPQSMSVPMFLSVPSINPDAMTRSSTPCDANYQQTGAFKLGTLKITNGSPARSPAASPAPLAPASLALKRSNLSEKCPTPILGLEQLNDQQRLSQVFELDEELKRASQIFELEDQKRISQVFELEASSAYFEYAREEIIRAAKNFDKKPQLSPLVLPSIDLCPFVLEPQKVPPILEPKDPAQDLPEVVETCRSSQDLPEVVVEPHGPDCDLPEVVVSKDPAQDLPEVVEPQDPQGLQTTSRQAAEDADLFDEAESPGYFAEVLHVRRDSGAKVDSLSFSDTTHGDLSRKDSGIVASPGLEFHHKRLTKADSGYSSSISVRSFSQKRSVPETASRQSSFTEAPRTALAKNGQDGDVAAGNERHKTSFEKPSEQATPLERYLGQATPFEKPNGQSRPFDSFHGHEASFDSSNGQNTSFNDSALGLSVPSASLHSQSKSFDSTQTHTRTNSTLEPATSFEIYCGPEIPLETFQQPPLPARTPLLALAPLPTRELPPPVPKKDNTLQKKKGSHQRADSIRGPLRFLNRAGSRKQRSPTSKANDMAMALTNQHNNTTLPAPSSGLTIAAPSRGQGKLQRMLSTSRAPLTVHSTHPSDQSSIPEIPHEAQIRLHQRSMSWSSTNSNPVVKGSNRLSKQKSKDTLATILSVGSAEYHPTEPDSMNARPIRTLNYGIRRRPFKKRPVSMKINTSLANNSSAGASGIQLSAQGPGRTPEQQARDQARIAAGLQQHWTLSRKPSSGNNQIPSKAVQILGEDVAGGMNQPVLPSDIETHRQENKTTPGATATTANKRNTAPPASMVTRRESRDVAPPSQKTIPAEVGIVEGQKGPSHAVRDATKTSEQGKLLSRDTPSRPAAKTSLSSRQNENQNGLSGQEINVVDQGRWYSFQTSTGNYKVPNWRIQTDHDPTLTRAASASFDSRGPEDCGQLGQVLSPTWVDTSSFGGNGDSKRPYLQHRASCDGYNDMGVMKGLLDTTSGDGTFPSITLPNGGPFLNDSQNDQTTTSQQLSQDKWRASHVPRSRSRNYSVGCHEPHGSSTPYRVLHSYNTSAYRHTSIRG